MSALSEFEEKEFYLEAFRRHTLLFASPAGPLERDARPDELIRAFADLAGHEARALLVVGHAPGAVPPGVLRRLIEAATKSPRSLFPGQIGAEQAIVPFAGPGDEAALCALWRSLSEGCRVAALATPAVDASLWGVAAALAVRLRVAKLVLLDPAGAVKRPDGRERLSFLDAEGLERLLRRERRRRRSGGRGALLAAVREAIGGGVKSVNLCDLANVERELFTYEGAGTLFTAGTYCRVERLGIDDFRQVAQLVERGQREGFLRSRTAAEIGRVLLTGYGATVNEGQIAGVCALETRGYERERAGEIVALYTITRFKGEGVGARLLERVLSDAQAQGLRYVFACTVDDRACQFFERHGFRQVGADAVPRAKWDGYDPVRRGSARVLKRVVDSAARARPRPRRAGGRKRSSP